MGKPPVVAIHGGPAFCHNYMLPLKLLVQHGHPVIFYDQCGCGRSSFVEDPRKNAPWLLTIDYYLDELSALLAHCKLENYYLYGSSWGTIVAQEFAVKQPTGLLGLVLDGALCDSQLYIRTQWRDVISTMPTYTQNILRKLTDAKDYDSLTYRAIEDTLNQHFVCRLVPQPECYEASCKGTNHTIYRLMQGESEFTVGGVLEHWTITDRLARVQVPTLVLRGQFDTMTDECSRAVADAIPAAWPVVTIPRASHCKLLDEPHLCVEQVTRFLHSVESARRLPNAAATTTATIGLPRI